MAVSYHSCVVKHEDEPFHETRVTRHKSHELPDGELYQVVPADFESLEFLNVQEPLVHHGAAALKKFFHHLTVTRPLGCQCQPLIQQRLASRFARS